MNRVHRAIFSATEVNPEDVFLRPVTNTYFSLRVGLGVLSLIFPVSLLIFGHFSQDLPQDSMSAYYYTHERNLFTGCLCAIGPFLFLYFGYNWLETWLLNIAGLCAILVAFCPMSCPDKGCIDGTFPFTSIRFPWIHNRAAIILFVCIGAVSILCSHNTLRLFSTEDAYAAKQYRRLYRIIGVMFFVIPAFLFLWFKFVLDTGSQGSPFVYWVEFFGVVIFGLYWIIKSRELKFIYRRLSPEEVMRLTSSHP